MNLNKIMNRREMCGEKMITMDITTGKRKEFVWRCGEDACPHCRAVKILHGHYARLAVRRVGRN